MTGYVTGKPKTMDLLQHMHLVGPYDSIQCLYVYLLELYAEALEAKDTERQRILTPLIKSIDDGARTLVCKL